MEETDKTNQGEQSTIIREAVAFSASTYIFQFISLIRGLVIIQVLSPSLYGIWSILRTFLQSSSYLGFGSYQAMVREVPYYEGQGKPELGLRVKQNTLTWCLLVSLLAGMATWAFSFTASATDFSLEIRLSALVFILNAVYIYITFQLKSEREIFLLSRVYLIYAVLNTVFGLALIFAFGITGLLAGMALSSSVIIIGLARTRHFSLKLQLQKETMVKLIGTGFPIMLVAATTYLMTSIDKLVIFIMLGSVETGYFSLASFFSEIINYLPYAITTVLLPRMVFQLGQNRNPGQLEHYYTKPLFLLAGIVPILLGLIFINIDLVILYAMPKYESAITVLRILIMGLFFAVVSTMPKNILIAFNKQKILMRWVPFFLLIGALIDVYAIHMEFGIVGVAIGSAIVLFGVSFLTNFYALSILKKTPREKLVTVIKIYGPFLYILSVLLLTFQVSVTNGHLALTNVLRSLVFCILCVPLIVYVNKHSEILKKVCTAFARPESR